MKVKKFFCLTCSKSLKPLHHFHLTVSSLKFFYFFLIQLKLFSFYLKIFLDTTFSINF